MTHIEQICRYKTQQEYKHFCGFNRGLLYQKYHEKLKQKSRNSLRKILFNISYSLSAFKTFTTLLPIAGTMVV